MARRLGIAAGACSFTLSQAAGAAAAPTITVTPDDHLADQQLVTVTGTGLEEPCVEGQGCFPVGVLECLRGAVLTISTWDESCAFLGNAEQTTSGYQASVRVHRTLTPRRPGSSPVACGRDRCDVVAGGIAGQFTFVRTPISFSK